MYVSLYWKRRLKKSVNLAILILFTLIVLDAVNTTWALHNGISEANPFIAWAIKQTSIVMAMLFKMVFSFILLVWVYNHTNQDNCGIIMWSGVAAYVTIFTVSMLYQVVV